MLHARSFNPPWHVSLNNCIWCQMHMKIWLLCGDIYVHSSITHPRWLYLKGQTSVIGIDGFISHDRSAWGVGGGNDNEHPGWTTPFLKRLLFKRVIWMTTFLRNSTTGRNFAASRRARIRLWPPEEKKKRNLKKNYHCHNYNAPSYYEIR